MFIILACHYFIIFFRQKLSYIDLFKDINFAWKNFYSNCNSTICGIKHYEYLYLRAMWNCCNKIYAFSLI